MNVFSRPRGEPAGCRQTAPVHCPVLFSCYVIGETSLALQCCEKLLLRGHTIHGVISPNSSVIQWADDKGIRHMASHEKLADFLQEHAFEYLFSIVNNKVLPDLILSLPRKGAINFHDALLPRYGGIHATSWAILNHEHTHGITWHLMQPRIDAGGILKQRTVAVTPNDTALTLNIKCYQAGVEAFAELIDDLASETAVAKSQNLQERTYFSRYKRPAAGCMIAWDGPAENIDALVRALDFGPYPNLMGAAKTVISNDVLIVPGITILPQRTNAAPGTVIAITDSSITVATKSNDVQLPALLSLDGQKLAVADLKKHYGLKPGHQLQALSPATAKKLTDLYAEACRHEPFWLARLQHLVPAALPDMSLTARTLRTGMRIFSSPVPEMLLQGLGDSLPAHEMWQYVSGLFAAFLSRHTGVTVSHIGLRTAGLDACVQGLEGFFKGYVPVRCSFDAARPLSELLPPFIRELREAMQHMPISRDVAVRYPELRPTGTCRLPIIIHQTSSSDASLEIDADTDVRLVIAEDSSSCRLVFNMANVDEDYARSIAGQFSVFMEAAGASRATPLERLPLVSEKEQQKIIRAWNETACEFDRTACIHQLFEHQATCHPDAIATICEGSTRTYGALNHTANQIARYLVRKGVRRGMLVGICLDRSHDMIAGLMAILKAGGAYVPLEPSYPRERIATIVSRAGIRIVLSQEKHAHLVADSGAESVFLDRDAGRIAGEEKEQNLPCQTQPTDIAYVIYTSGSTGTPKGVVVAHRPVINLFEWAYRTCSFSSDDCVLFITSLGFDLSVFDVFGLLGCGGKIHIVGDSRRRDIPYLARMLCEEEISFWDSAPAALQLLIPHLKLKPHSATNRKFRQIFLSGDWIPVNLPDDIREVFPAAHVMSLGGATEATVWSNYFPVNRVEPTWRSIPYGRPIQNSRYYILDAHLAVCPPGVTGDLYIAGDCLSVGYLNEPGLTAASYVPDPFSKNDSEVMYRTGDLARYFPDGTIEFLGRRDFQVKVRGYRIELGEIEQVLRNHRDIQEAVVTVRQDSGGVQKLIAYVVPCTGHMPPSKELRAYAAEFLTEYMVPNAFIRLAQLPLSANGKVDRAQLPWPVSEQAHAQPVEKTKLQQGKESLCDVLIRYFKEALAVPVIGIDNDFFDLGVTSLNLIEISEKLSVNHGITIPVEAFLDNASIRSLAGYIMEHCADAVAGLQQEHHTESVCPAAVQQQGECQTPTRPLPSEDTVHQKSRAQQNLKGVAADILKTLQLSIPVETLLDPSALHEIINALQGALGKADTDNASARSFKDTVQVPTVVQCSKTLPDGAPLVQGTLQSAAQPVGMEHELIFEISKCFLEELDLENISPDDDFFDLGVTSLNLIQIAEKLQERHNISVPIEVFLDHSSIRTLAGYITGNMPGQCDQPEGFAQTHSAEHADVRRTDAHNYIELERVMFDPGTYLSRSCTRVYEAKQIPLRMFSQFLSLLKQEVVQGNPKYLYPSAGGLNAVQTYLYIKKDSVEGIAEGIYYYHPLRHVLIVVGEKQSLESEAFHPYNRPVYNGAAFCIFFIAQLTAIQPVYSVLSTALATLDAGYMGQLLMSRQAKFGIGLCPVAGIDFERIRSGFRLDESHTFIHCLLGGAVGSRPEHKDNNKAGDFLRRDVDRKTGAGLTDHFTGPRPDREVLGAVSTARLNALNALSDAEHELLHQRHLHIRSFPEKKDEIRLHQVSYMHNEFLLRSTQRSFQKRPLSFTAFSRFLGLLKASSANGTVKYLYPSAGAAYAVSTFVYIKQHGVEKIPEGIYFYNPVQHALYCISSGPARELPRAHFPGNRSYFSEAGFCMFLIGQLDRVRPIFESESLYLTMLEAGYMGQLLMDRQAEFGVGVCPIGAMRFDIVRNDFKLTGDCRLLHSFLCGPVDRTVPMTGHEYLKII